MSGEVLGRGVGLEFVKKPQGSLHYLSRLSNSTENNRIGRIVKERSRLEVFSYNMLTGMIELKPIIGWYRKKRREPFVCVKLKRVYQFKSGAVSRPVVCTDNHEFWATVGDGNWQWVAAANLRPGMYVWGIAGGAYEVKGVDGKIPHAYKGQQTYQWDIEVADNHNYFAGGALVHSVNVTKGRCKSGGLYDDKQAAGFGEKGVTCGHLK